MVQNHFLQLKGKDGKVIEYRSGIYDCVQMRHVLYIQCLSRSVTSPTGTQIVSILYIPDHMYSIDHVKRSMIK